MQGNTCQNREVEQFDLRLKTVKSPQASAVARWCLTCEVGPDRRRTIAFVASDFKCGRLSSWQILVLHL